jgi:CubicO group peptidase (beta-lactamase class C family)
MKRREFLMGTAATLTFPGARPAFAQAGGFTEAGLDKVEATLTGHVAAGLVPGATWLLARGDEVHVGAVGTFEVGGQGAPMARDTIFRIASAGKPIFAAGVMMLVDDGKISLDEPAERLLPELADRSVLTALNAPLDSTVPAERPILVRDIMNFTFGFGMNFDPSLPIEQAVREAQLATGFPFPPSPHTADEWMRHFGELPLMAQPGATWFYNVGSHLQAVLIERASGKTGDVFLKERIFDPLGMVDTGFFVPPEKLHRLPPLYTQDWETGEIQVWDPTDGFFTEKPPFANHTPGLVSTVDDYLAFARLLLNKGEYNDVRLLSEQSVAEMTRDQLTPEQKASAGLVPGFFDSMGWGFGMAVWTAPSAIAPYAGRYGWDGGYGTSWANDPATGLIGILMTQSAVYYISSNQFAEFWMAANAAAAG